MNVAVGVVTAALVAAVAILLFLLARTLGGLRTLKRSLDGFRGEAEPAAREILRLAEQAASRAQGMQAAIGRVQAAARGRHPTALASPAPGTPAAPPAP